MTGWILVSIETRMSLFGWWMLAGDKGGWSCFLNTTSWVLPAGFPARDCVLQKPPVPFKKVKTAQKSCHTMWGIQRQVHLLPPIVQVGGGNLGLGWCNHWCYNPFRQCFWQIISFISLASSNHTFCCSSLYLELEMHEGEEKEPARRAFPSLLKSHGTLSWKLLSSG